MANDQLEIIDPDNVPETLCIGRFNVAVTGGLVTLTFTHARPDATAVFGGRIEPKAVVRARIVTTIANMQALRDVLVNMTQGPKTPVPATGGTTRH